MPELPEVETVRRGLEKSILNKKITEVIIKRKNVVKEPGVGQFKKGLIGKKVKGIIRRAKLIIIKLENNKYLIIHLRIAGWLEYGKQMEKARVVFKLSNEKYLNYMDQRLLGELRLRNSYEDLNFIKTLGPEPFDINSKQFQEIITKRKTNIKTLLLNQKVIAGIGNIYAQEALFLSGIDPQRPAYSLSNKEAGSLLKKIILVLKEGIKYGGSSVDTYRNIEGSKGGMEKRLKVYGRENEPCFSCGKAIAKIALAGRGTCFCAYCQK
tara:strand:+ start:632 stop:1432 length:801 start_codon:yes stop_codon:yes gene_type:complete